MPGSCSRNSMTHNTDNVVFVPLGPDGETDRGGLTVPGHFYAMMRRLSKKREALEREYREALRQKLEDHGRDGCTGCGMNLPVTPSHYIPRSFDISLLADPDNFGLHCDICADLCETGNYQNLLDGEKIADYIEMTRPDYYRIKEEKHKELYGKDYNDRTDWMARGGRGYGKGSAESD